MKTLPFPGGAPKEIGHIKELAREHTAEAIGTDHSKRLGEAIETLDRVLRHARQLGFSSG